MTDRNRAARLLLSYLIEPGDAGMHQMIRQWGAQHTWDVLADGRPAPNDEVAEAFKRWRPRILRHHSIEWALEELVHLDQRGIRLLIPGDSAWPYGLADLGDNAPIALFVRGDVDAMMTLNLAASVSIVGARAATSYGEHVTTELAADLATTHVVVSGAAYGIDGTAHRATIAAGGRTIAFLAGGVDRPYPAGHDLLIARIAERGAVVSEVPPGSTPTKWRFLARNRLIAAVSQGTLVVEAGWRSGSLNAAGHALAIGRPVMAVPGPVTSAASAGCHRLIAEMGATLVTSAADVRSAMIPKETVR